MPRWRKKLEQILDQRKLFTLRPDLEKYLSLALSQEQEVIASIAKQDVEVECSRSIRAVEGSMAYVFDQDLLSYFFAAVYVGNSLYFGSEVSKRDDRFKLKIKPRGVACHQEAGMFRHEVTIPPGDFSSEKDLFSSLDAESRHAVHQTLLQDKELYEQDLVKRAFHIIAETIDEGEPPFEKILKTRQPDPYLNDFFFAKREKNGHEGAKFILRHLSSDPEFRRQQLYWLVRVPIRKKRIDNPNFTLYNGWLAETLQNCSKKGKGQQIVNSRSLVEFYEGTYVSVYTSSRLSPESQFMELRRIARSSFPYIPGDSVELNGRKITAFASQLDYIVLKLILTGPEQLYRNAQKPTNNL